DQNALYWKEGSFAAIRTVGDVLERSADLEEIQKDAKLITSALKQANFEQIQGQIKEVRDLVKVAIASFDNKGWGSLSDAQMKN
ncbi:hypothetical protein ACXWOP_09315, partial [Streptococcus pyogenes]